MIYQKSFDINYTLCYDDFGIKFLFFPPRKKYLIFLPAEKAGSANFWSRFYGFTKRRIQVWLKSIQNEKNRSGCFFCMLSSEGERRARTVGHLTGSGQPALNTGKRNSSSIYRKGGTL